MTNDDIAKLPELLTVEEARRIVNIGKTAMYCLIRENKDFPSVNLGARRTRIIKTDFLAWIKRKALINL